MSMKKPTSDAAASDRQSALKRGLAKVLDDGAQERLTVDMPANLKLELAVLAKRRRTSIKALVIDALIETYPELAP